MIARRSAKTCQLARASQLPFARRKTGHLSQFGLSAFPSMSDAFKLNKTDIPHPDWKAPQPQPVPYEGGFKTLDVSAMDASANYPLVISTIVPRPIGFLSTKTKDGKLNLSPYSYFGAMGHDPPLVAVSCCKRPGGDRKDSCRNILDTGEFVVNIMSTWFLEAANHTCGAYDPDVDEFAVSGLTPLASEVVAPPRVAESAVHMECKLAQHWDQTNKQGEYTTTIILGEVLRMHLHEGVVSQTPSGHTIADPQKLAPVCRLGGNTYGVPTTLFDLARPGKEAQTAVKK